MKIKIDWDAVGGVMFVWAFWTLLSLLFFLCISCTVPKTVEEHHHYYKQADTTAVQALVDAKLNSWHESADSMVFVLAQRYTSEMSNSEQEHETITESVTSYVDSLGREVRQEQRTTERNLSRQQQQRVEQLQQEMEQRWRRELQRVDSVWQARYDAIQAHWEESDSAAVSETPAAEDNRPWWKRWEERIVIVLGAVCAVLIFGAVEYFRRK